MRRECVAQGMRVQVPIDVRHLPVLLYYSPHRPLPHTTHFSVISRHHGRPAGGGPGAAKRFRNPFISAAEGTEGGPFGNFGVGTSRAGFSLIIRSRTQYLKNERSAASFRAIELFSSPCSCRCPTNSRMIRCVIFGSAGGCSPGGERYAMNCSRSCP